MHTDVDLRFQSWELRIENFGKGVVVRKIRTGIIGPGKVARLHADAMRMTAEAEFVGVCGRNMEKARVMAGEYGVAAYTDVREMREKSGVEMVCVCTPHPEHAGP